MNKISSLRSRVVYSYLLLSALVCGTFVSIFVFAEAYVERDLIYGQMSIALEQQIAEFREVGETSAVPGMSVFVGDGIPEYLRSLVPRAEPYEIIGPDGEELTVLLRRDQGLLFAIAADFAQFEFIELVVTSILVIATLASLIAALSCSIWLVNRAVSPLTNLTNALAQGNLKEREELVAGDDELGILARAIIDRDSRLSEYLFREKLFTGDVSHELRTPLTIILGASEVLKSKYSHDAEAQQYIERIRGTASETAGRITALLLLSRSPETAYASDTVLAPLVEHEIDRYRYLLKSEFVDCEVSLDGTTSELVRPELVGIAFGNLIRNAFQYTEKGQVRITLTPREFRISNTGGGLPESVQHRLFERFVRGAKSTSAGSGLGLSIVQRVCEHVGWALRYHADDKTSATFSISFGSRQ